jgi:hypothetical protein
MCYDVVMGRHFTEKSATTKMKTCLDMVLFLAGLSRVVATYHNLFSVAKVTPNSHAAADCRTEFTFIFWLVSRLRQSLPNGLLDFFIALEMHRGNRERRLSIVTEFATSSATSVGPRVCYRWFRCNGIAHVDTSAVLDAVDVNRHETSL